MKKITVLIGVLIVMGMVVSPVLGQEFPMIDGPPLPGVPLPEQQQEVEIQLPDYSDWQATKAVGYDTDLDGRTDFYCKIVSKEEMRDGVWVVEMLHMHGKFGKEPEWVLWMASEMTRQGPRPIFIRGIIRKDDGKYYQVPPPVFKAKTKEFSESLPKYAK